MTTPEMQTELIKQYSPIIYFHPDEKYFPCSSEWLMKNSTLVDYNISPPKVYSDVTNQVMYDVSKLYNFQRKGDGELILSFDNSLYKGEIPIKNVPIYTLFREEGGKIFITYIVLYAYNGEYPIFNLIMAGMHPCDIEHITVQLDKGGILERIFYGAHGTKDGRWVEKEDIPLENGKIVCYVALTGHGMYPKEGIVFRLFGVANDHTAKGQRWEPKPFQIFKFDNPSFNPSTMGFFAYNGRLGGPMEKGNTDGITGLPDKSWFQNIEDRDQNTYNSPTILSPEFGGLLVTVKDVAVVCLLYFFVYFLLQFSKRFIKGEQLSYKNHFFAIFASLIIFALVISILKGILKKYVPS